MQKNKDSFFLSIADKKIKILAPVKYCQVLKNVYADFISSRGLCKNVDLELFLEEEPLKVDFEKLPLGCTLNGSFLSLRDHGSSGLWDIRKKKAEFKFLILSPDVFLSLSKFLRIIVTYLIIRKAEGALLHACALLKNKKAFVFQGPSGAGKTTVAQFSLGKELIDDEIILLKKAKKNFFVYPLPNWRKKSKPALKNRPYPISALFFLEKDKRNFLKELTPALALAKIYSVPVFLQDPKTSNRIFAFFYSLLNKKPAYELHFLPDCSFWKELEKIK